MAEFHRSADSTWRGNLRTGEGLVSSQSGALKDASFSFVSRFENGTNTNPEELIAAAHAGCYSMALANGLSEGGNVPEWITTKATVTLRIDQNGPKVTKIHLHTEGKVPGIDAEAFKAVAEQTKTACPISVLLTPGLEEVSLEATLVD